MKAKTPLQQEIIGLSRQLCRLTEAQKRYAFKHCFEHLAHRNAKNVLTCLECGHSWKGGNGLADTLLGVTCPHCGMKLEIAVGRKRTHKDIEYFSIITTCNQYQVIRFFRAACTLKVGLPASYSIFEVAQRWISPDGTSTTVARNRAYSSIYYDLWLSQSKMEIRPNQEHHVYDICPACTYPKQRFIKELKRNGFEGNYHGMRPYDLFMAILGNGRHETLLKAGQISMLRYTLHSPKRLDNYWDSVKICLRNNYSIVDASMWCDYIDMLRQEHKDIRNAHYVCPANLKEAHDKLVDKRNKEKKRERLMGTKEYEEEYKRKKSKFFGLMFTDGTIRIKVLESVEEFMLEGDELRHCVYANNYFKRDNSLILSATIEGIRMETIEVSLSDMQVVQCRGKNNGNTPYHERILQLVNNNMNEIRACMSA